VYLLPRYPFVVFVVTLIVLWVAAWVGATRLPKLRGEIDRTRGDFAVIQGAALTLLGLIIGFTFSMAVGRYDQRKNLEEEEANAIGTEYLRASLLPAADAAKVKALLVRYTESRILYYTTRDDDALQRLGNETGRLQNDLWNAVREPALAQPHQINALVVSGMNDVINSQGYTQAAFLNRIPPAAWALMMAIAICAALLVGLGLTESTSTRLLLPVVPIIVSIAMFLIADIDSPRRGMIAVVPVNLISLKASFAP
jgi:hypothetical protein